MYKIIYCEGDTLYKITAKVEEEVKNLKSQGWSEQGGVSVSTTKFGHTCFYTVSQAMVKK